MASINPTSIVKNAITSKVSNLVGGSKITTSAQKLFSKNLINNVAVINSKGNNYLQFPNDILNNPSISQYTYLHCKQFKPEDWSGTTKKYVLGSIYLPLPLELNVEYKSNWTSVEGNYGGVLANADYKKFAGEEKWGELVKLGAATGEYSVGKITEGLAESAGIKEGVSNIIRRVMNPMKLLNWNAPDFRSFQFTYDLAPATGQESEDLNQIIYWLKRYIHTPTDSAIATTLEYPPLWDITFVDAKAFDSGKGNKYLFKTTECAITSIGVDYLSKGRVFHKSDESGKGYHAPNGVRLTISFTETKILTQNDFGVSYPENQPTP